MCSIEQWTDQDAVRAEDPIATAAANDKARAAAMAAGKPVPEPKIVTYPAATEGKPTGRVFDCDLQKLGKLTIEPVAEALTTARILSIKETTLFYLPRDWKWSLAAVQSHFSGAGVEWPPSFRRAAGG